MRKVVTIWMLFVAVSMQLMGQPSEAQMRKTISEAASAMRSMQCDFVQTKRIKMLNDQMVSKGKMYYQQRQRLRWEYTSPYTYTFVLNNDKVLIRNQRRNDVIDVNQNKMFREIAQLMMNSVLGRCLNDKAFKSTLAVVKDEWVATLLPQRKDMRQMFQKIVLHFTTHDVRTAKGTGVARLVQRVELIEKNGDQTVIDLKNVKTNETISADMFAIR